jgi:Fur family ferric uptake transcriptional regulator
MAEGAWTPAAPTTAADPARLDRACVIARDRMESRIERLCIDRGLKMTGQRRVIARVLSDATDHPDVEELYRRAAALDSHISIATVYRTVRLLEENGILERRDFGGGRARYEPTEHGNHYHLIDIETGRVIEFQDAEHERLMQTIAARLGFDLVSLRLELFGRRTSGQPRAQAAACAQAAARAQAAPVPHEHPDPGAGRNGGLTEPAEGGVIR